MTTFVVRLQPLDPPGRGDTGTPTLRGVVDEIATGVTRTFTSTAELLDILLTSMRAAEGATTERWAR